MLSIVKQRILYALNKFSSTYFFDDIADVFPLLPCMQPMTLAFVYVGTTIKDIADISHGGAHFTRARIVSNSAQSNK